MKKKKIVVVGAGNAGLSAYKVLAKESDLCQVTIISQESYLRYSPTSEPYLISNPIGLYPLYGLPFSPFLVPGQAEPEGAITRDFNCSSCDHNHLLLKRKAVRILPKDKKVILDDGGLLAYDALIICTGAKPVAPFIEGKEGRKVFLLRTQSDVEHILAVAKTSKRIAIIGAGPVGIEAAVSLSKQGLSVVLVEKNERVLPNCFDQEAASLIQSLLEQNGIELCLNSKVSCINQDDQGNVWVSLEDKGVISCDLVVIATGAEPDIDVVKDSGIEVNRGILVNALMETNYKDIYAAGDVAEAPGFLPEQKTLFPTLMDTVEQGRVAATNALGLDPALKYEGGLHVNVIALNGSLLFSIGELAKPDDYDAYTYVSKEKRTYLKLIFDNDRLVGAMVVNLCLPVGIMRSLILSRVHLEDYKDILLQKPNVPDTWASTALAKLPRGTH